MNDIATQIRAEIAKHESEIKRLKEALAIIESPHKSAYSKKSGHKSRGEHMLVGTYTVNGVDLHLGTVQFNILETLDKAEDCVQRSALEPFCNGDRKALHQAIFQLKAKLKPAGATIEFFTGEGYRLQNIEDS